MTAITTPRLKESTDSLLRFALRLDAVVSGVCGVAILASGGWLAEVSGMPTALEYVLGVFFVAFAVGVFMLAAQRSVRRAGITIAIGNLAYTVGSVVFVLTDVVPLTTTGVVLTLAVGAYTAVVGELQYQGWRRAKV
jgi:hypothetical protein